MKTVGSYNEPPKLDLRIDEEIAKASWEESSALTYKTTNSVVAVMEGGKPVVIANAEGMRTTPSVVGFSKDGERLVGQLARRQTVLNPQNTFYSIKRFVGRKYTELDPVSKRVPYTIRRDDFGNVKIACPRMRRDFAPEELSAMILRKLADDAQRYLGEEVTGA